MVFEFIALVLVIYEDYVLRTVYFQQMSLCI